MKVFRAISSLMFAFLVLVSSTSFMVGVHYCGGKVQDIALFTKAEPCAMEQSMPPCHKHMKSHCCEDKVVMHEGEGFKASAFHLQLVQATPVDIEQPLILISEIIPSTPVEHTSNYNYDPPLRSADRIIELQVFLI
jgi:hypothetical protein